MPGLTQAWPIIAACWSPAMPSTGTGAPSPPQLVGALGGAAVLPDDGIVDRLAGGAVPDDGGLTLIGDANAGQRAGLELGLSQRAAADFDRGRPDLVRVVFDPTGPGKD